MHTITLSRALLIALALAVPAGEALAGSTIDWTVDADGGDTQMKVQGCVDVEGHIYADDAQFDLDIRAGLVCGEVIVFPAACDNPRPVRKVVNARRVVIIPKCNG